MINNPGGDTRCHDQGKVGYCRKRANALVRKITKDRPRSARITPNFSGEQMRHGSGGGATSGPCRRVPSLWFRTLPFKSLYHLTFSAVNQISRSFCRDDPPVSPPKKTDGHVPLRDALVAVARNLDVAVAQWINRLNSNGSFRSWGALHARGSRRADGVAKTPMPRRQCCATEPGPARLSTLAKDCL